MKHISPYLKFNGNCRETMAFYKHCLGEDLTLNTVAGSPMESMMPPAKKSLTLHVALNTGKATVMVSDMVGSDGISAGNNVTTCVVCETQEEIEEVFVKMSAGRYDQTASQPAAVWHGWRSRR